MEGSSNGNIHYSEFENKTDEEVVDEAKNGSTRAQEFLISKYENFVKAKSKSYFLIGADKERYLPRGNDRII